MALEAVVYPQDPFGYSRDQYYALAGELPELADEKTFLDAFNDDPTANNACCWDYYSSSSANTSAMHGVSISSGQWPALDPNSSSPETTCAAAAAAAAEAGSGGSGQPSPSAAAAGGGGGGGGGGRRKRRRCRSSKNKEEIENQRMTHIAVERNRRKQMNEYLAVLRSLMPPSYSQRGDQASIIGGAINFVKELEQLLQSMQTHKSKPKPLQDLAAAANNNNYNSNNDVASPFAEFFSFPQYSTRLASAPCGGPTEPATALEDRSGGPHPQWVVADIEVTMVESHANMKIFSKKRPRQLLQLVAGLQGLRLTVLHLNVTTVDDSVLYSVSVKVEEGCHLNTVDEIAAAVHELLRRIEEGAGAFT